MQNSAFLETRKCQKSSKVSKAAETAQLIVEQSQTRAKLTQIETDQARQAAENARDQAIQANQAKSQFLSRMSHEIRTPMNGILGYLSLIPLQRLEEADRQNVQQAIDSSLHLRQVVNEILNFFCLQAGEIKLPDGSL